LPLTKIIPSNEKAQQEASAKITPLKDKGSTTRKTTSSKDIALEKTKSTPSKDITLGVSNGNANQDLVEEKLPIQNSP
jgi:hypothetical protein